MTTTSSGYVGVDVSKDTLDVAVLGQQRVRQYANTQVGIAESAKGDGAACPGLDRCRSYRGIRARGAAGVYSKPICRWRG